LIAFQFAGNRDQAHATVNPQRGVPDCVVVSGSGDGSVGGTHAAPLTAISVTTTNVRSLLVIGASRARRDNSRARDSRRPRIPRRCYAFM
jgi:hypothetical protein